MTVEIHSVGAMRFWSETDFAEDGTGTLANYTYVPFNEGTATLTITTDELDTMAAVQSRIEGRVWVNGKKSATLTWTQNEAPTGVAAGDGITAVTSALGDLLKATMGGQFLGTGSTFAAASTAEIVNVTSAAGFLAGSAIGWRNSSNEVEYREIESIATNAITLKHAFSAAPAATDIAYAVATNYITENPAETLQFIVEGVESEDRWLLLGGQAVGGMTPANDPSGASLPTVTFNLTFADYKMAGETIGTLTGTLDDATYTNYEPIVGFAGECRVFDVGTSTLADASLVHVSAFSAVPKIAYVPIPSPAGKNGIYGWRAGRANPPAEGSFVTFFEDLEWWTARDAKTPKHVQYQAGQDPGSTIVTTVPTVQISDPQRTAAGELAGQTIKFRARRDTDTGSSTTELARSPFRKHFG